MELTKFGFPVCVGCGYCCISFPCFNSVMSGPRCESLYWNGSRYKCSRIENESDFAEYMAEGIGCPSNFNSWRDDVRKREV